MTTYYVMPKNEIGQRTVIANATPKNMINVDTITLPDGDYLTVISKNKEFPAHKIALAVAIGQINIDDVEA